VTTWCGGMGEREDTIVDDSAEEMVDGEVVDEEEDTIDISSIRSFHCPVVFELNPIHKRGGSRVLCSANKSTIMHACQPKDDHDKALFKKIA
jgi:hypothetical protein